MIDINPAPKIFQFDIGTELLVRVIDADDPFRRDDDDLDARAVDLSAASLLIIRATKPDDSVVEWIATGGSPTYPQRTAARGWMHYVTLEDDLDQAGHWRLQPRIAVPGWSGRADHHHILVHP